MQDEDSARAEGAALSNFSVGPGDPEALVYETCGRPGVDRIVRVYLSAGGVLYHKKITLRDVKRLVLHGMVTPVGYVRYPLVHLIGGWDPEFYSQLEGTTREFYYLSSAPRNTIPTDLKVVPELLAFRDSIHTSVKHPVEVRSKWIGCIDYDDTYLIYDNRADTREVSEDLLLSEYYYWRSKGTRKLLSWVDHTYPTCSKELACRAKLSASDVMKALIRTNSEREITLALWLSAGLGNQTLTRILLYSISFPGAIRVLEGIRWAFTGKIETTRKNLKELHTYMRSVDYTTIPGCSDIHVDNVLYLNCLLGRVPERPGQLTEDLENRFADREESPLCEAVHVATLSTLDAILAEIESFETTSVYSLESLHRLCTNLTSGSSSIRTLRAFTREMLGKLTKAEAVLLANFRELRQRILRPGLTGRAISKLEPGARNRPLLPSSDSDWIRWTLLLMWVEGKIWRLVSACPLAWDDAMYGNYARTVRLATAGGVCFGASDFDDYNQLHTNLIMSEIALRIGKVLADDSGDPMYLTIAEIISKGIKDSKLTVEGVDHRTHYGLWSGWRSTTFINTLMNPVYNRIIGYIEGKGMRDGLFMGDDSIEVYDSIFSASAALQSLDENRFYAQHSKQMISLRRVEFLRIMWRDGLPGSGSLIRGISNAVSSDLQGGEVCNSLSMQWFTEWVKRIKHRGANIRPTILRRLSGVVNGKIHYYLQLKAERNDALNDRSYIINRADSRARRKTLLTDFIVERCRKYSLSYSHVRREVYRSYLQSYTPENTFLKYTAPREIECEPDVIWTDTYLRVSEHNVVERATAEMVSRLLGPVACSVTARQELFSKHSLLQLVTMAHLSCKDRHALFSAGTAYVAKCAEKLIFNSVRSVA